LQNPSKDFVPAQPLRYGQPMSARPAKRSLTLHGHRTSVSLEAAFWEAFRKIAAERGIPINQLAAEIDDARSGDEGLASAIRVFVLNCYRAATPSSVTARSP
jgi:predicted DNA-binding ribbon-helix-helix protein